MCDSDHLVVSVLLRPQAWTSDSAAVLPGFSTTESSCAETCAELKLVCDSHWGADDYVLIIDWVLGCFTAGVSDEAPPPFT